MGDGAHEGFDEVLGRRLLGDLVVVVDDEPRVGGPVREVLAEDLGQRLGRSPRAREAPAGARAAGVAVVDESWRASRDSERKRGDVGRRRARREPRARATVAHHPLLGECRLAVAGRSDERPHARLRLVEEREQPRSLDDPALADPYF